nr:EamA family transporter [Francisella halioticida]
MSSIFLVIFQAYITTIFGYKIWNNLMKKYSAITVAPLSLIVPISGMLCSYMFFDEKLTYIEIIAACIILLGIVLFFSSNSKKV